MGTPRQSTTLGLIFGGTTSEHDVTLLSASSVLRALPEDFKALLFAMDRQGRWLSADESEALLLSAGKIDGETLHGKLAAPEGDRRWGPRDGFRGADVLFPLVHGTCGEDGTLQGLLEYMGLPYVGSGVGASAVGMNKAHMKAVFRAAGIPIVDYVVVRAVEMDDPRAIGARIEDALEYPLFVKPSNAGSSVGISKVKTPDGLLPALQEAFDYDDLVVVERGLSVREVECAALGNARPEISVIGEIRSGNEWYDYEAKYTEGLSKLLIPAPLPESVSEQIRQLAVEAVTSIGCEGLTRVDFFYEEATGRVYLNEVNTLPGFTETSMYPKLWAHTGLAYPTLIRRLVELAVERHGSRKGRACTAS